MLTTKIGLRRSKVDWKKCQRLGRPLFEKRESGAPAS
jgi:hypothetical protein